jgi:hypothetical protein
MSNTQTVGSIIISPWRHLSEHCAAEIHNVPEIVFVMEKRSARKCQFLRAVSINPEETGARVG